MVTAETENCNQHQSPVTSPDPHGGERGWRVKQRAGGRIRHARLCDEASPSGTGPESWRFFGSVNTGRFGVGRELGTAWGLCVLPHTRPYASLFAKQLVIKTGR